MLPSGFEPESPARKARMIGRATLQEQNSGKLDNYHIKRDDVLLVSVANIAGWVGYGCVEVYKVR